MSIVMCTIMPKPQTPDSKTKQKRLSRLATRLEAHRPFVRASVVVTRKPCIRENCRACRQGRKHLSTYLVASSGGKPKVRYLPKALLANARRRARNWRATKRILEEMSQIWIEDLLEKPT